MRPVDLPLTHQGKIKRSQIKKGYEVLTEIQGTIFDMQVLHKTTNHKDLLQSNKDVPQTKIKDCTNRFYTLLPHDFGRQVPLKQRSL